MARSFNGTSDKIVVGTSSILRPTNISISAWIKPTNLNDGHTAVSYGKQIGQSYNISIGALTAGKIEFICYNGGWISANGASSLLTSGAWNHVLGTYDGTTTRLYVNGTITGTTGTLSALDYTMPVQGFVIGIYDNNGVDSNFWNGSVAEVEVWNTALMAGEAKALSAGVNLQLVRPNARLGYWPLWGLASREPDLSGNALNGTLTGTVQANHAPVTLWTPKPPTAPLIQQAVGGIKNLPPFQRMAA